MTGLIMAAGVIGAIGIVIGVLLGIASEKFKVEVDEREILVRAELPGNNCGGCGFPGCDGLANAIAAGNAAVNACPVGGAAVAEKIAAIMGVEAGGADKKVAFVKCKGTCDKTRLLQGDRPEPGRLLIAEYFTGLPPWAGLFFLSGSTQKLFLCAFLLQKRKEC